MSNPCKNVCSHLCLLRPGGYTCACPQGSSPVAFASSECDAGKHLVTAWTIYRLSCCVAFHFVFHSPCVPGCACVVLVLLIILCMPGFCSCSHWGTCCNAPCMSMHEWWNLLHWWRRSAQVQVSVVLGAIYTDTCLPVTPVCYCWHLTTFKTQKHNFPI